LSLRPLEFGWRGGQEERTWEISRRSDGSLGNRFLRCAECRDDRAPVRLRLLVKEIDGAGNVVRNPSVASGISLIPERPFVRAAQLSVLPTPNDVRPMPVTA
jgi:hypothetical protein